MAGREKQFDQAEALNNALNIFWAKGFEATSMQELVSAMGVNRASMYQTYGNKDALFNAAFDGYRQTSLRYIEELLESVASPIDSLYQLLSVLTKQSLENNLSGCFVNNSAAELGPHNPMVAEKIREFWLQLELLINNKLLQAVELNEIKADSNTVHLASFINTTLQGLLIKTKADFDDALIVADIDALFALIKQ